MTKAKTYTYNGKTMTVKEWAEEIGITPGALWNRLNSPHWTVERALTSEKIRSAPYGNISGKRFVKRSLRNQKLWYRNGHGRTMQHWAQFLRCSPHTIYDRMRRGQSFDEAYEALLARKIREGL